ncbi:MAG TPA: EAL domain-containing protein [Candidatus Limnocylindrales bacterium]|nr:EAL domain-containing protein [Candidatus Limnocylindrales bacterium]
MSIPSDATWARRAFHGRRPDPIILALAVYAAVFGVWSLSGVGSEALRAVFGNLVFTPLDITVFALAIQAVRQPALPPAARRGWALLAAAFAAYGVANAGWAVLELGLGVEPFPSWVDAFYLAYYPLTFVALLILPRAAGGRREVLRIGLDVGTVVVGGGMVIWHLVLRPTAVAEQSDTLTSLLSLAYPVGDLVLLLGAAIVVFRRPAPIIREPVWLLGAGLLAFLVSDVGFGALSLADTYETGGWTDAVAVAAIALSGMAARWQTLVVRRPAGTAPESADGGLQPFFFLPYLAVALGYGILLHVGQDQLATELGELIIAAVVLTGLVVVRQAATLREIVRLQSEQVARRTEARFRSLVQNAADLIVVVDKAGQILYASPSIEQRLALPHNDLVGTRFADIVHPHDAAAAAALIKVVGAKDAERRTAEWRVLHSTGGSGYVEAVAANQLRDGDVRGIVLTMRDVEERKTFEQRLAHQAFHDPLTNLANRALFGDRVEHALSRARRAGGSVAVLFLDLDDFKRVNDSFGHQAGDQLLLEVAHRLEACIRPGDTAARLGGDEFGVLVEDPPSEAEALAVAERIRAAMADPFHVADAAIVVTASLGVALSGDHAAKASELLRNADLAMYAAKAAGKGVARRYEPSMHSTAIDRIGLEERLRDAVERGEIVAHYQPIATLADGRIGGVEALARWEHPERGLVLPDVFVPLAEETGLIDRIGRLVLATACRDAAAWSAEVGPIQVSVNLSARQLATDLIVDDVRAAIRASALPADRLILEITESVLLADTAATVDRLRRLKDLGVRLSIDDFGTGYSALSYLRAFPLDELKIDRSFISAMRGDPRVARLVGAIVQLGAALGLDTVAEGVEDRGDVDMLRSFGCDRAQGFLFSRPVPADVLGRLLRDQAARSRPATGAHERREIAAREVSTPALVETA